MVPGIADCARRALLRSGQVKAERVENGARVILGYCVELQNKSVRCHGWAPCLWEIVTSNGGLLNCAQSVAIHITIYAVLLNGAAQ